MRETRGGRRRWAGLAVFCALVIAVVTWSSPTAAATPTVGHGAGSVTQAYLVDAPPGVAVDLRGPDGTLAGSGRTDALGSFLVRNLPPGPGYRFVVAGRVGNTFAVLDQSPPPAALYRQTLRPGLNYIRVRDGITLAATVRLPLGKTMADGPFPTLIEYSGYQIAAPGDPVLGTIGAAAGRPDPLAPASSTMIGGILAPAAGFATVNLQMRGSGCSGGAFDLFDYPTVYDGYDVIETVARQPWVANHRVGMVGVSFSGISQIAVAGTRPPSLAAIAPMSITDDLYSTGFPGGIFNSGFANSWVNERQSDARPAPAGGQPYARELIRRGDRTCAANQRLRWQTQNVQRLLADNPTRTPSLFAHRSPSRWASRIDVPVFLAGSLQDEQTGPQWTSIIPELDDNPNVWVRIINGSHADSTNPHILSQWYDFLNLFVAQRVPPANPGLGALSPVIYEATVGAPGQRIVTERLSGARSTAEATARFARDPRVQVIFGNGTETMPAGNPSAPWTRGYRSWPPASVGDGVRLALNAAGRLGGSPTTGTVAFRPDPSVRPSGTLPTTGASPLPWRPLPPYRWAPVPDRAGVSFVSAPRASDTLVVGPAALDLRLASSAPDTDLQATVSEVRPDGRETYVSTGYLRASLRAVDADATPLHPSRSWLDPTPLPPGFSTVRISVGPIAYAFRAGSRIRVTITAPGGDRPSWRFATPQTGGRVVDTLALGPDASALVLPIVPGGTAQTPLGACDGLRGQPCRVYTRTFNGG